MAGSDVGLPLSVGPTATLPANTTAPWLSGGDGSMWPASISPLSQRSMAVRESPSGSGSLFPQVSGGSQAGWLGMPLVAAIMASIKLRLSCVHQIHMYSRLGPGQ